MKQYKVTDFRTPHAQQQVRQVLSLGIDEVIYARYKDTDIMDQVRNNQEKMLKISALQDAQKNHQIQFNQNDFKITLNDEQEIKASDALKFLATRGKINLLSALEVFEATFSKTTDRDTILELFTNADKPRENEINFSNAPKIFPADMTYIYFETLFETDVLDLFFQQNIHNYIASKLEQHQIATSGPTLIDFMKCRRILTLGWTSMKGCIEDEIIPQTAQRQAMNNRGKFKH